MYDRKDDLTLNERAWLRFLRDVSNGSDPEPTLRRVQLLRRLCRPHKEKWNGFSRFRRGMAGEPCLAGSLAD